MLIVLEDWFSNNPWVILVALVLVCAVIGGIAFLIHRILNKNHKEEKPSEEEIAKETMDRYLVDVDEQAFKEVEEEKDEKKENQ